MKRFMLALGIAMAGIPAAAAGPAGVTPQAILAQTDGLRPGILRLALTAYENARRQGLVRREVLTIIDFERPSYEKRLWVIDMRTGKVLFEEWVAHGMGSPRGSGGTLEKALEFSNAEGSLESSLGLYITSDTYLGKHGYSLRLDGMEPGFNDSARKRLIVLHGAAYVTPGRAENHLIGRSWGCPVVRPEITRALIDAVKGGSVIWAYYPDPQWLAASRFLRQVPATPAARHPSEGAPPAASPVRK